MATSTSEVYDAEQSNPVGHGRDDLLRPIYEEVSWGLGREFPYPEPNR